MSAKKKAASTTANLLDCDKSSHSSRVIQQVRSIFLSGRKVTAKEINAKTNSNDARRVISTLRNDEGWNIVDCRLSDNRKLYWLAESPNDIKVKRQDTKSKEYSSKSKLIKTNWEGGKTNE